MEGLEGPIEGLGEGGGTDRGTGGAEGPVERDVRHHALTSSLGQPREEGGSLQSEILHILTHIACYFHQEYF